MPQIWMLRKCGIEWHPLQKILSFFMITFFWKEWDHPCLLVKISKTFPVFMIKPCWIGWNPLTPFAKYSKKIPAFLLRRFRISEEEKNRFLHECFPFSETIQPNHLWHHGPTYAYSHRWGDIHLHSFSHKIFNTEKHTFASLYFVFFCYSPVDTQSL